MKPAKKILLLSILCLAAVTVFLLWGLNARNWEYNLPRRLIKLAAICLTGGAIGYSTVIFQTAVNNRILTPSVMGLDSLYLFIQTLVVFVMGADKLVLMSATTDYLLSVGTMMLASLLLYRLMFKRENVKLFMVILMGMMLGSLFGSLATFMQVMIDPNEFLTVQARMFASFNNINTPLLGVSAVLMGLAGIAGFRLIRQFDVLSLGRDISINLGVPYHRIIRRCMLIVSVMVAVSTALVGPITFLGLLAANLSRQMMRTYKHRYIIAGSMLCACIALVGGQFFVERVLAFSTPISVVINFVGSMYFLYLLLKEGRPA